MLRSFARFFQSLGWYSWYVIHVLIAWLLLQCPLQFLAPIYMWFPFIGVLFIAFVGFPILEIGEFYIRRHRPWTDICMFKDVVFWICMAGGPVLIALLGLFVYRPEAMEIVAFAKAFRQAHADWFGITEPQLQALFVLCWVLAPLAFAAINRVDRLAIWAFRWLKRGAALLNQSSRPSSLAVVTQS